MRYVIRDFKGPEVQKFVQISKKTKYFEKKYRENDALNDVLRTCNSIHLSNN